MWGNISDFVFMEVVEVVGDFRVGSFWRREEREWWTFWEQLKGFFFAFESVLREV